MKREIEQEIVIYAKITNPDALNEASGVERQIQYENPLKEGQGRTRVRMTEVAEKEREYTFTLKLPTEGVEGAANNEEFTMDIEKSCFEAYGLSAPRRMTKNRYKFNSTNVTAEIGVGENKETISLPSVIFEVDVYQKSDGTVSEWCKIDIEIESVCAFLSSKYPNVEISTIRIKISHLPFKPKDAILSTTEDAEEKAQIGKLWEEEFLQK